MRIGVAMALGAGGGIRVAAKSEAQIGRILHARRQGQNVVEFANSLRVLLIRHKGFANKWNPNQNLL
jgi:hypothetical protein